MNPRAEPRVRSIGTDPAAFTQFYRAYVDEVTRFVARRVADPQLAADLTAEVFLAVIEAAAHYRGSFGGPRTCRVDEVLLLSRAGELRFRPPLRVTAAPFDPQNPTTASRGKYGAWWIGDWQGITTGAGAFHLVWNDTRMGKLDLFAATVRP